MHRKKKQNNGAAVDTAVDFESSVTAIYNAIWPKDTGGAPPKRYEPPTIARLVEWCATECPSNVVLEARECAARVLDADINDVDINITDNELRVHLQGNELDWREVNEARKEKRRKHPIAPVIRAFLNANPPVTRSLGLDPKSTAVLPSILAQAGKNNTLVGNRFTLSKLGDNQPPTLPLDVLYCTGRDNIRANPTALLIWLSAVFGSDITYTFYPQVVKFSYGELLDIVFPDGYKKRYEAIRCVKKACLILERMTIPAIDSDIANPIVDVHHTDGESIHFKVTLPRGCQRGGPDIDLAIVRQLSKKPPVILRAYLNLMLAMHVPGKTRKRPRNRKGAWHWSKSLRDYGRRIFTDGGKPFDNKAREHIIQTAYPGETPTGSTARVFLHRALKALAYLKDINAIRVHIGHIVHPRFKPKGKR